MRPRRASPPMPTAGRAGNFATSVPAEGPGHARATTATPRARAATYTADEADEVLGHLVPQAQRSKYGNVPVVVDGERFDSKAESKRHQWLLILQKAGAIKELERQPRYRLEVDGVLIGHYVGDWEYLEKRPKPIDGVAWSRICEDKKGVKTALFKWKAKHFRAQYPNIELRLS